MFSCCSCMDGRGRVVVEVCWFLLLTQGSDQVGVGREAAGGAVGPLVRALRFRSLPGGRAEEAASVWGGGRAISGSCPDCAACCSGRSGGRSGTFRCRAGNGSAAGDGRGGDAGRSVRAAACSAVQSESSRCCSGRCAGSAGCSGRTSGGLGVTVGDGWAGYCATGFVAVAVTPGFRGGPTSEFRGGSGSAAAATADGPAGRPARGAVGRVVRRR